MATVAFKKGSVANLPTSYTEGTFYVATDERALYLDISNSARVRIGDFQEFENLEALKKNTNPSTTALYYVKDINVLAKWNGSGYVQINLDTGMTSVEMIGEGNAVTGMSYDAGTRKLTVTKGATYTTAADVDSKISAKTGEIGEKTIKDYVDESVSNVVAGSIEGLGDLASKDKVAEGDLETTLASKLNGKADVGTDEDASSVDSVKGAKKYADEKAAAVQGEVDALEAKIGTVEDESTVVQMIEANTAAIGVLNGEATTPGSVKKTVADEIAKVVAGEPDSFDTLKEVSDWISTHGQDAASMNSAILALQGILDGIGDTDSGEKATVAAYVADAIAALNIGDYAKAAELTSLADRVTTLEGASHTHANADELNKIASGDKAKWDAAEQNAKDYADGLASNYDAAGSAAGALEDAKEYAEGLLAWGSF